ncbi:hypothetical protein HHK36_001572 [Tetracentron sinense]|uniref:Uncharacterized protein n=1 Tax=Tetracentron sinense TaxID=13715 RepID=A0A835DRS2_TETSI|nr:hypothetical protein HHK36_001572 [Tetracentron sinense]
MDASHVRLARTRDVSLLIKWIRGGSTREQEKKKGREGFSTPLRLLLFLLVFAEMEGEGITSGSLSPPDAEISSVGSPEITCTQEASPPFTEIQSSSETVAPTEDLRDKIIRQWEVTASSRSRVYNGKALPWYTWMKNSVALTSWDAFAWSLEIRFGPTEYDDPVDALTKLRQTSTVDDYQTRFETLANRTDGLNEPFMVSCFLSDLKDDIRFSVKMFKPSTLSSTFGLARIQEEKINSRRKPLRNDMDRPIPNPNSSTTVTRKPSPPFIHRLTQTEMKERRDQDLCYNCKEKWAPGHHCKAQKLYLLDGVSNGEIIPEDDERDTNEDTHVEAKLEDQPEISLHALAGAPSPQMMRLKGSIQKLPVVVLINSRSTHNFLDPMIAKKNELNILPNGRFEVMVANGEKLVGQGRCDGIPLTLHGRTITIDFYLLSLEGCDVVLGAHWLRTLGPIIWDFSNLSMKFNLNGEPCHILGESTSELAVIDEGKIKKTLRSDKKDKKGYNFTVEYKHGRENKVADALSRRVDAGNLMGISQPIISWFEDIKANYKEDPEIQQVVARFHKGELDLALYTRHNDLLFYKGRFYLSSHSSLLLKVLQYLHESPNGGHSGLPLSQGKNNMMVVIDRLSKYAHFIPISHPYTASTIVGLFVDHIFKLHGMPLSIVSDRDPTFLRSFWKEFFKLRGTQLNYSSAYHHQSDGQSEIVNRCLKNFLRCFVGSKPKEWLKWISLAEWWYNTNSHSSTGMSPHEVVYGIPPRLMRYVARTTQVQAVDEALRDRDQIMKILRDNLVAAQDRMKRMADLHRSEREFSVGDWVEYYFSDENLPTDNFLMKYVKKNKDGFATPQVHDILLLAVPVAVIASFRKIRKLGQDNSLIVAALKESSHLVVSPDGKKVRRIHPLALTEVKDPKSRTVLVENLPEDHSTENIQKIFGNAGKVKNICIRDPHAIEESSKSSKAEKLFSGKMHALVEYETVEEAEKAVATLNDEENWRSGMRVGLLLKRMGKYGITKRGSKESTASEKNNNVPASDATGDDQKLKSNEHHDETREEVEGERPLNERNGWRGRSRGRSRGQKQHYIIGQGHGTVSGIGIEGQKPPPGPRMPDGTRGFTMGRGRPPVSNQ